MLLIITSTGDELFRNFNIDNFEWPWTLRIEVFSDFLAIFHCKRVNCDAMDEDRPRLPANSNCHRLSRISWALAHTHTHTQMCIYFIVTLWGQLVLLHLVPLTSLAVSLRYPGIELLYKKTVSLGSLGHHRLAEKSLSCGEWVQQFIHSAAGAAANDRFITCQTLPASHGVVTHVDVCRCHKMISHIL